MKNKVAALRKTLKLSQAELAKRSGTSQQQIQRVEAGQVTRVDLAHRIAKALGADVGKVFPGVKASVKKMEKMAPVDVLNLDYEGVKDFADRGFDHDPRQWIIHVELRNGVTARYLIAAVEKVRLEARLRDQSRSVVVFDSAMYRVAICSDQLATWSFLFELRQDDADKGASLEKIEPAGGDSGCLKLWFPHKRVPMSIEVARDEAFIEPEEEDEKVPIATLFFDLDQCFENEQRFCVEDVDEEYTWFRADSIAMATVPLWVVLPDMDGPGDDEDDDD